MNLMISIIKTVSSVLNLHFCSLRRFFGDKNDARVVKTEKKLDKTFWLQKMKGCLNFSKQKIDPGLYYTTQGYSVDLLVR